MAALVLGGAKPSARVVRLLRRALEDEDFDVRDSAAASLAELGDTASIPSLMRLLDSTPPRFGRSIAWGLERLARDAGQQRRAEIVEGLERYRRRARGSSREHADVLIRRLRSLDVSGD